MAIDLRQLRQFVTIAELGSYRRAADTLHIAQPALSVSIQKLEHAVGVPLLARGARGVTLTPAGEALMADARRALFHTEQARQAARRVALGEWGTLRLGFVGSATYTLLPRCLPAFRAQYPDVQLELREDSTVGLAAMLRANDIDAGLVRGPLAEDPALESWVVERDDLILAVPAGHPLAGAAPVQLDRARGESFVMYSPAKVPGLHGVAQALCRKAGFSPRISQEAIQVQTLVSLVASGMGLALVPGVTRAYSTPLVAFVPLADADARDALSLSLVTHRDTSCASVLRLRDSMLAQMG
ncbi:LysR family transcriptional regulator [Achromobacter xylosoxidans]|uniref:LysR family transcriptional regulator n=1 Tax=Alcaligenes xylosoxydans xylosoxydans TaxID=85698 RepID=UPI0006C10F26|nr:LysR family transcriptional regulator [Achromobacter xylosoxidans]MCH4572140.1 LysR substrate-binding domain-containing protein [Achromobacter xylosoxidans]MDD7991753.1 LysR substrate-binding domain-containing protein [Achromobacter xylosoxidans]CUJ24302.1 Hca operon transcriptional activator [Achromobacter xylosoxidans]CUJ70114.1 Hca operon transcriptional activator [Achromobacter xylosoxidans]CUK18611.1 Hca operon transcriptional activator [Achromobacter xylosoxidans]